MNTLLDIFVEGDPQTKGSVTAIVRGKRALVIPAGTSESRKAKARWRKKLEDELYFWRDGLAWEIPDDSRWFRVEMMFVFTRPKSTKLKYPSLDTDKLLRLACDCLESSGVLWNDSRIVKSTGEKRWAEDGEEAGCHVKLWEIS